MKSNANKWAALLGTFVIFGAASESRAVIQPVTPYECRINNVEVTPPTVAYSTGNKSLIFIRVAYNDDHTDPQSEASAVAMMNEVNAMLQELSFGQLSLTTTVTPLVFVGKNKYEYFPPNRDQDTIHKNAVAEVKALGYNYDAYDLAIVRFQDGPGTFAVYSNIGTEEVLLKVSDAKVALHGILHNLGLFHANAWTTTDGSSIGPGANSDRGDPFDSMADLPSGDLSSINAYEKNRLNWLPSANITTVTTGGIYRIYALDHPTLDATKKYAIKIQKDPLRSYWLEFRQKDISNPWLMDGVLMHWAPWSQSANGSQLIDATPDSPNGTQDAPIAIGQTLTDAASGIGITPLGKGGTSPESIDIAVSFGPANIIAEAGANETVTDSDGNGVENIVLNGAGSSGSITSYVWTEGATQIATGASPTVPLRVGTHTVALVAQGSGSPTSADSVTITVNPGPFPNQPPTANAGPNLVVADSEGKGWANVTLNGSASSDPDGSIVDYEWRGVEGNGAVIMGSGKTLTLAFLPGGPYTMRLTVTDNSGAISQDDVLVKVTQGPPINQAPTASAGPNQTVTLAAGAVLNGTVTDAGTYPVTWSKVSGPRDAVVTFGNANAEDTTATFSKVGVYVLRLTANDGVNPPVSDDIQITVQ